MQIKDLYQKVSEFETHQTEAYKNSLQCKKGCSKCCYVDLSVFEIESDNIWKWFEGLDKEKQDQIRNRLSIPQTKQNNFAGNEVLPCAFLRNEECSIYDARPLICRTQGNALFFQEQGVNQVDICPLNENSLDVMDNADLMNLDLLNTILAQMNYSLGYSEKRVDLKSIAQKIIGV